MTQVNIVFQAKIKSGLENDFYKVVSEIMHSTRAEDEGCINFTFHKNANDPSKFFAYEQWRDEKSMNTHFERIVKTYGAPREGDILSAKIMEFFEEM